MGRSLAHQPFSHQVLSNPSSSCGSNPAKKKFNQPKKPINGQAELTTLRMTVFIWTNSYCISTVVLQKKVLAFRVQKGSCGGSLVLVSIIACFPVVLLSSVREC